MGFAVSRRSWNSTKECCDDGCGLHLERGSIFCSSLFFLIFSKASSVGGNLPILEQTLWVNFFLVEPLFIRYLGENSWLGSSCYRLVAQTYWEWWKIKGSSGSWGCLVISGFGTPHQCAGETMVKMFNRWKSCSNLPTKLAKTLVKNWWITGETASPLTDGVNSSNTEP